METARASLPRTLYPSPFPRGWEELESGEVMDKTFSERLSIFKHHLSNRKIMRLAFKHAQNISII